MRQWLVVGIGLTLSLWLASAATNNEQALPFHPISQDQYNAILGLTDGEPIITEARLIASGIAALKGLAAGLKLGFSGSWLPSIFSAFGDTQESKTQNNLNFTDGYPLCVVENRDDHERDNDNDDDEKRYHRHESDEVDDNNEEYGRSHSTHVLKCVVVVKNDADEHETPTERPPESPSYAQYPHYAYPYPYPWFNGYYPPQNHYDNSYQHERVQQQYNYRPNYRYSPNDYSPSYDYAPYQQSNYHYSTSKQHHSKTQHATKSHHRHSNKNRQTHPSPENYYDYTVPPTIKRSKTKRDQYSTHANQPNYAQISSGYQPATYPQFSYHSHYPKVSYSPSHNYPSPVYVNTTPLPQHVREQDQDSSQSEENEF